MNEPTDPKTIDEIGNLLEQGQKIQAIKVYREATQCDLRTAKEFVEGLMGRLAEDNPERFAKVHEVNSGCGKATLFLLAGSVALVATGVRWWVG